MSVRNLSVVFGFVVPLLCTQVVFGLTKQEALRILGTEVLLPSSSADTIEARMLPYPLASGIVEPGFGGPPTIDIASISGNPQWFAMVDLFPCQFFAHDVIYVFIDDVTGGVTTYDETSWPTIDDVPLGQNEDLILVFPLIPGPSPVLPGAPTSEPVGDYGDAPDGQWAYDGVMGAFPTFYATTNSVLGRPGVHALNPGLEMLGVTVSAEQDVVDPSDPDGVPNLVDADSDGRMFLSWDPTTTPPTSHLIYDVTVDAAAPEVYRYTNALFDFDRNGRWSGDAAGREWPVVNEAVDVPPGVTETQITSGFDWGDGVTTPTQVWIRVVLARSWIDPDPFIPDGWDGSGEFAYGEIEDFLVYVRSCPPGPPPSGDPPPPQPPRPGVPWDPGPIPEPRPLKKHPQYALHALVVQGADNPGQTFVREAADRMHALLTDQGYNPQRLSGPNLQGNDVTAWIAAESSQVQCGDQVMIYFIAHGYPYPPKKSHHPSHPRGLIHLTDDGDESRLNGDQLDEALFRELPPCQKEDGKLPERCHDVTVIMESCFSGLWLDFLTYPCRLIIVTSLPDQCSWAGRKRPGCEYSNRYIEAAADPNTDADNDGFVTPTEIHNAAVPRIDRPQNPDMSPWPCWYLQLPKGGCCLPPEKDCILASEEQCLAFEGIYLGDDTECLGDLNGNGKDDACETIPTVSEWGLVILALLLLVGAKLYFGRRSVNKAA